VVRLRIVAQQATEPNQWNVSWVAPELGLHAPIATVSAGTLCGVLPSVTSYPQYRRSDSEERRQSAMVTCSAEDSAGAAVDGSTLWVNGERHAIPAGTDVELPGAMEQPAREPCTTEGFNPLDVRLRRDAKVWRKESALAYRLPRPRTGVGSGDGCPVTRAFDSIPSSSATVAGSRSDTPVPTAARTKGRRPKTAATRPTRGTTERSTMPAHAAANAAATLARNARVRAPQPGSTRSVDRTPSRLDRGDRHRAHVDLSTSGSSKGRSGLAVRLGDTSARQILHLGCSSRSGM
jgi:hypothetical protein